MYTVHCPPFYWKVNGRKNTAHIHQIHNAENIHLGGPCYVHFIYTNQKRFCWAFCRYHIFIYKWYIQCFSWSIFPNQIHPFFFFFYFCIRSLCSSDERRLYRKRSSYNAIYLNGSRGINLCYCRIEASLLNNFFFV